MRSLAIAFMLFAVPSFATARSVVEEPTLVERFLAQSVAKKTCCKHCGKGIPCGDTCIAANRKCKSGPGCAC